MNLRGTDLPLAPVFNAYAILTRSGGQLEVFIDSKKITEEIQESLVSQLSGNLNWYSYEGIYDRVQHYVRNRAINSMCVTTTKICQSKNRSIQIPAKCGSANIATRTWAA